MDYESGSFVYSVVPEYVKGARWSCEDRCSSYAQDLAQGVMEEADRQHCHCDDLCQVGELSLSIKMQEGLQIFFIWRTFSLAKLLLFFSRCLVPLPIKDFLVWPSPPKAVVNEITKYMKPNFSSALYLFI